MNIPSVRLMSTVIPALIEWNSSSMVQEKIQITSKRYSYKKINREETKTVKRYQIKILTIQSRKSSIIALIMINWEWISADS